MTFIHFAVKIASFFGHFEAQLLDSKFAVLCGKSSAFLGDDLCRGNDLSGRAVVMNTKSIVVVD